MCQHAPEKVRMGLIASLPSVFHTSTRIHSYCYCMRLLTSCGWQDVIAKLYKPSVVVLQFSQATVTYPLTELLIRNLECARGVLVVTHAV